jgi:hypothetical protein
MNSEWTKRLGTGRAGMVVVALAAIGFVWLTHR